MKILHLLMLCIFIPIVASYVFSCEEVRTKFIKNGYGDMNFNEPLSSNYLEYRACVIVQEGFTNWEQLKRIRLETRSYIHQYKILNGSLFDIASVDRCDKTTDAVKTSKWIVVAEPEQSLDCTQDFSLVIAQESDEVVTPVQEARQVINTEKNVTAIVFAAPKSGMLIQITHKQCANPKDPVGLSFSKRQTGWWHCEMIPDWILTFENAFIMYASKSTYKMEFSSNIDSKLVVSPGERMFVFGSGHGDSVRSVVEGKMHRARVGIAQKDREDNHKITVNMVVSLSPNTTSSLGIQMNEKEDSIRYFKNNVVQTYFTYFISNYFEVHYNHKSDSAEEKGIIDEFVLLRINVGSDEVTSTSVHSTPTTTQTPTASPTLSSTYSATASTTIPTSATSATSDATTTMTTTTTTMNPTVTADDSKTSDSSTTSTTTPSVDGTTPAAPTPTTTMKTAENTPDSSATDATENPDSTASTADSRNSTRTPNGTFSTLLPVTPRSPKGSKADPYCNCDVDDAGFPVGWAFADIWLDVVFILDTSEAMGNEALRDASTLIESFISDGVDDFLVTDEKADFHTRVGVISMSESAEVLYALNMTKADGVRDRTFISEGVPSIDVVAAYEAAVKLLNSRARADRAQVRRVIYYMTNSDAEHNLINIMQFKNSKGVIIVNNFLQDGAVELPGLEELASVGQYFNNPNFLAGLQSLCKANCFCTRKRNAYAGADPAIVAAGGCYHYAPGGVPFNKAKGTCEQEGGFLATIHDAPKSAFLTQLTARSNFGKFWMGYMKSAEGVWQWLDQSTDRYTNWAVNEPSTDPLANCGYASTLNNTWAAANCHNGFPYICQYTPCSAGNKQC